MKSIIDHPAPNIVPGLNLTAARFNDLYAWVATLTADSSAAIRNPYRYGLTMAYDNRSSLVLEKEGTQLILKRCCGITPGGSVIGHFEGIHTPLTFDLSTTELRPQELFAVLIEANHSNLRVFGPESKDLPLRPLYSAMDCRLHVQPADQTVAAQSNSFRIGILKMEHGQWQLTDYVPPCAQLGADSRLNMQYKKYLKEFDEMMDRFPKIIQHTDAYQQKSMIELREFALQLGSFMAMQRFRYRHIGLGGLPFDMFEFWVSFSHQISFMVSCLKDRAGFFNLLNENTNARGVPFGIQSWYEVIENLKKLQYDHNLIVDAIQTVDKFLEKVTPLFTALTYGVEEVKTLTSWKEEKPKASSSW